MQSSMAVAEDAMLINSIIGDAVRVDSLSTVAHCHLMSHVHVNTGCTINGLIDSDISVSNHVSSCQLLSS